MNEQAKLTREDLPQFTGSENWYRHPINRKVTFTDGAKYVADMAGAYWLLDEIAIIQPYDKRVAAEASSSGNSRSATIALHFSPAMTAMVSLST
jgi:hypothetical protein